MKKTSYRFFHILILIGLIIGLDQASKAYILHLAAQHHLPMPITSFFSVQLVWNRGISFGLMNHGVTPKWLYLAIGCVTGLVAMWLWRSRRQPIRWPLALVIAGALGNIIDRLRFNGVVDFLDFYIASTPWGPYHWPAFNIADASITLGGIWLFFLLRRL